jgi:hypothetical protein
MYTVSLGYIGPGPEFTSGDLLLHHGLLGK